MADNTIKIGIKYEVDKVSLESIKKQLREITNTQAKDYSLKKGLGLEEARVELNHIRDSIGQLQGALNKSYNSDLGTLNISKFNKELKGLPLQEIYTNMSKFGAEGKNAFRNIMTEAMTTNTKLKQTSGIISNLSNEIKKLVKYNIASSVINSVTGQINQAYGYVKNLDRSLADIRIVTKQSKEDMAAFAREANRAAQDLKTGTVDYTDAALIWAQSGLRGEDIAKMGETTMKVANVTRQSGEEAASQLMAIMNGFKISVDDAELAVSKIAGVAANSASNLQELSASMGKVASMANQMGVSQEQLSAMLGTTISVTRQSAETVGTAFKSILNRMSDIKAGEGEISLGTYTTKMKELGVNVLDSSNKLREMGNVIEEVGSKWDTYSKEEQRALASAMGGTYQSNMITALFENFDEYERLTGIAATSTGELQAQQEEYANSVAAKLEQLTAAWENLFDSLLSGDTIGGVADFFTIIVNGVANFVDGIGGGGNVLLAFGSIVTKVFSKDIARGIFNISSKIKEFRQEANKLSEEENLLNIFKDANKNNSLGLDKIIEYKEKIMSVNSILTDEEREVYIDYTKRLISLQNEIDLKEELINKALQYKEVMVGSDQEGVKDIEFDIDGAAYSEFLNILNRIKEGAAESNTEINQLSVSLGKYQKATSLTSQDLKELSKLQTTYSNLIDKSSARADRYAQKIEQGYQSIYESAQGLLLSLEDFGEIPGFSDENRQDLENFIRAYQDGTLEILNSNGEITDDALEFSRLYREFNQNIINEINNMIEAASPEMRTYLEQMRDRLNQAENAMSSSLNTHSKMVFIQDIVNAIGSIGELTSGLIAFRNAFKVWSDDSLSFGEKLIQSISGASMGIGTLKDGWNGIQEGILAVGKATGKLGQDATTADVGIKKLAKGLLGLIKGHPIATAVIAGTTAAIIGLGFGIKALIDWYNKDAIALQKAKEKTESLKKAHQEVLSVIEKTEEQLNTYKELETTLNSLVQGSKEWEKQLLKVNDQVLELLSNFPKLAKYVTNNNGKLEISQEGKDYLINEQIKQSKISQQAIVASIIDQSQKEITSKITDFARSYTYDAGTVTSNLSVLGSERVGLLLDGIDKFGFALLRNQKQMQEVAGLTKREAEALYKNNSGLRELYFQISELEETISENNNLLGFNLLSDKESENATELLTEYLGNIYRDKLDKEKKDIENKSLGELIKLYQDNIDSNAIIEEKDGKAIIKDSFGGETSFSKDDLIEVISSGIAQAEIEKEGISDKAVNNQEQLKQELDVPQERKNIVLNSLTNDSKGNILKDLTAQDFSSLVEALGSDDFRKYLLEFGIDPNEIIGDLYNQTKILKEKYNQLSKEKQEIIEQYADDGQTLGSLLSFIELTENQTEAESKYTKKLLEIYNGNFNTINEILKNGVKRFSDIVSEWQKLNQQINNLSLGQKITKEELLKLNPALQEYFSVLSDGTYQLLNSSWYIRESINKQKRQELNTTLQAKRAELQKTRDEQIIPVKRSPELHKHSTSGLYYTDKNGDVFKGPSGKAYSYNESVKSIVESLKEVEDWETKVDESARRRIQTYLDGAYEQETKTRILIEDYQKIINILENNDIEQETKVRQEEYLAELQKAADDFVNSYIMTSGSLEELNYYKKQLDFKLKTSLEDDADKIFINYGKIAAIQDKLLRQDLYGDLDDKEIADMANALKYTAQGANLSIEEIENLAKAQLNLNKALDTAASKMEIWNEILKKGNKNSIEYGQTISELRDVFTKITGLDLSNISDDFFTSAENLNLLQQALNGSEEAVRNIEQIFAQQTLSDFFDISDIEIGIDVPDNFQTNLDRINNWIKNGIDPLEIPFENGQVEQGIVDTINYILSKKPQAKAAMDQIGRILGLNAEVNPETVTVENDAQQMETTEYVRARQDGTATLQFLSSDLSNIDTSNTNSLAIFGAAQAAALKNMSVPTYTIERIPGPSKPHSNKFISTQSAASVKYTTGAGTSYGGLNKITPSKNTNIRTTPNNTARSRGASSRGGSGGGGGGSSSKPQTKKHTDIKKDIYHDINRQLELSNRKLNNISKNQDKAWGVGKLKLYNEELKETNKNMDLLKEKQKISNQDLASQRQKMTDFGFKFNSNGELTNYFEMFDKVTKRYNDFIDQYNKLSAEEQESEKWQKRLEEEEEFLQKFQDLLKDYEEKESLNYEIKVSLSDESIKAMEARIKAFKFKVEFTSDFTAFERSMEDYTKRFRKPWYKKDNMIYENEWLQETIRTPLNTKEVEARKQNLEKRYEDYRALKEYEQKGTPLDQIPEKYQTYFYKDEEEDKTQLNLNDFMEDWKEDIQGAADLMVEAGEMADQAHENFLTALDQRAEEFDKQRELYEKINSQIAHNIDIINIILGDTAFNERDDWYQQRAKNYKDQLNSIRTEMTMWEEQIAKETDEEARNKMQERWNELAEQLKSIMVEAMNAAKEQMDNLIDGAIDKWQRGMTNGMTFDSIGEQWELEKTALDKYLDDINSVYEVGALKNKYLDAIDNTDNVKQQQELRDLMEEQIGFLQEKEFLTRYDVERAEKLLDIEIKKQALEDAKNNKSNMRLRRDSQGNYTYQFVADEAEVEKAEQELAKAQNDLYNFDKDAYYENLSEAISLAQEYKEKIAEIYKDTTMDAEEKERMIAFYNQYYSEEIRRTGIQNEVILKNLNSSMFESFKINYDLDNENFKAMTGHNIEYFQNMSDEQKRIMFDEIIPEHLNGVQQMIDVWTGPDGFEEQTKEALAEMEAANQEYSLELEKIADKAKVDLGEIADGHDDINDALEKQITSTKTLATEGAEYIDTVREKWLSVKAVLDDIVKNLGYMTNVGKDSVYTESYQHANSLTAKPQGYSFKGSILNASKDNKMIYRGYRSLTTAAKVAEGKPYDPKTDGEATEEARDSISMSDIFYQARAVQTVNGNSFIALSENPNDPGSDFYWYRAEWLDKIIKMKTGGYTGEWSNGSAEDNGRLAFLHQKELVLNENDTKNLLETVDIINQLYSKIKRSESGLETNLSNSIAETIARQINNAQYQQEVQQAQRMYEQLKPISGIEPITTSENNVFNVSFPNATNHNEIEQAIENLRNRASQRNGNQIR